MRSAKGVIKSTAICHLAGRLLREIADVEHLSLSNQEAKLLLRDRCGPLLDELREETDKLKRLVNT
jgi:hypothetical protein